MNKFPVHIGKNSEQFQEILIFTSKRVDKMPSIQLEINKLCTSKVFIRVKGILSYVRKLTTNKKSPN